MTYYNENDPKTAAWLRELIAGGHIPSGWVDERSILDVKPHELTPYSHQHFFAGIGGWAYALRLAGWSDSKPVRTGSCPCQPFSQTGKQLGTKDERHLWPVFRDIITFGETTITFGEQVASPPGREWLSGVRADLEGMGYEVGSADLCAAGVGAPNIRQRLYWMAHCASQRRNGRSGMQGTNRRTIAETSRTVNRLADTDGWQSGDGGLQRSGGHVQQSQDETTGGLEHATRDGREQRGTESGERSTESRCGTDGLVQPDSAGRNTGEQTSPSTGHGSSIEPASGVDGLGNTDSSGSQGRNERVFECHHEWPVGTPNLVVCCTDGKARRFEPGSFPLAHGVSGRVGLLRGYGNAINPYLASQFIQACEEAIA